jgi:hypothetical protein
MDTEYLAKGWLLQRKCNDPSLDLGRSPVCQDRLAAAHLRQSEIAAFAIRLR